MANFQKHPSGEKLSGTSLVVNGDTITIGLAGYLDFGGQPLAVTNQGSELAIIPGDVVNNVQLYTISVTREVRAVKDSVSDTIFAITQSFQTWDRFNITFNFKRGEAVTLIVRPVTAQTLGGAPESLWRSTTTPDTAVVDVSTFRMGGSGPLNFLRVKGKSVKIAVFAAKLGFVERAFILLTPLSGKPSNLTIVITHGFGQNDKYYSGLGYSDPLSPDLIKDVNLRFVLGRWGAQLMAASNDYALLLPVRAKGGGQGELGPFISHANTGTGIVATIRAQTDNAFGIDRVEVVTFSSGIYEANQFVAVGGKALNIKRAINQDPAGGVPFTTAVPERKQYLSGQTTGGPRPGFEYLPLPRWDREPDGKKLYKDTFNYLHTWCIPQYTLYLAMAGR
jgi:hypothetical protein